MDLKRIRESLGEGAFWVLLFAGFFILIESYITPNPCCEYCIRYYNETNIPETSENNVLTNQVDTVE